jgi:hypothetical protein
MDDWPSMNSSMFANLANMGAMQTRVMAKSNNSGFDPYQTMLSRKKRQEDPFTDQEPTIKQHNTDDVKALEEFCQQYGILGFNCGTMSPRAALMFLKSKMGVRETEAPSYRVDKSMLYG